MSIPELATLAKPRLRVKIIGHEKRYLGMVVQMAGAVY